MHFTNNRTSFYNLSRARWGDCNIQSKQSVSRTLPVYDCSLLSPSMLLLSVLFLHILNGAMLCVFCIDQSTV